MNKKIKNAFSDVSVSENLERNILNMTVNKQKQTHRSFKLSYVCSIAVAVCLLSVTVVYAKEIKEFFQNWSTSIKLENGEEVKISENNNFTCYKTVLSSETNKQSDTLYLLSKMKYLLNIK